jgi:hypothetical protein
MTLCSSVMKICSDLRSPLDQPGCGREGVVHRRLADPRGKLRHGVQVRHGKPAVGHQLGVLLQYHLGSVDHATAVPTST